MQKKTIALAVAALVSGAAFAQSNVTLYGRADLNYTYSKSDFRKFQGIEEGAGYGSGGSHLGVRGEENLGNGLKAVFRFEWGVAADSTGDIGSGSGRYSYVGLAGNFGTVTLGKDQNPADRYRGTTGVMGFNTYEPITLFQGKLDTAMAATRWGDAIAYVSPEFSGFNFAGIYSFGEKVSKSKQDDGSCTITQPFKYDGYTIPASSGITADNKNLECADTSDAAKFGLGVRYANGPLYLTAIYQARLDDDSEKKFNKDGNDGYGSKGWIIGGTYDFKVVKLYANYFRVKADHSGRAYDDSKGFGSDKQTAWSLGVGIPVSSAGTIGVEYAQYKDDYKKSKDDGNNAKGYSLGYRHNLSKRTWLYSYVSRIDNDRGINASWSKTGVAGEKQTNFTTGIVHLF
jgi:predicted porin